MKEYSNNGKDIANNIRAERNRVKLSQSQVAKELGVSERTYISYEDDARNVKSTDISLLANLFGCKIDSFYVLNNSTKRETIKGIAKQIERN